MKLSNSESRTARLLQIIFFAAFILILNPHADANESSMSKEKILAEYQRAVQTSAQLGLYESDPLMILPRLKQASELILKDHSKEAEPVIHEIMNQMKVYESNKPLLQQTEFRSVWMELVFEVIQKFAWLALLAYFLSRFSWFRRLLHAQKKSAPSLFFVGLLFFVFGGGFMIWDLARYGLSAWGFFDLQLALMILGGWIGGPWMMLILGTGFLAQRFWFSREIGNLVLIYLGTFIGASILFRKPLELYRSHRYILICGLFAGLLHAAIYHGPMLPWIDPLTLIIGILSLMLLEVLAVFSFYLPTVQILQEETRQEQERELLKTRLLFLRAQMNPHFLFNALNTIATLCDREKASQSRKLVVHLSDFLRQMARKEDDRISLREETDYVEAYLEIEKARFGDQLTVQRNFLIPEYLWESKIPVLLIQPLVENAVKHGIHPQPYGGRLTLTYRERDGRLEIMIEDDGVGMKKTQCKSGAGIGLKNIQERLKRLYSSDHRFVIESELDRGTKITIQIPVWRKEAEQ